MMNDIVKLGGAVFEPDALFQGFDHFIIDLTKHPYCIFPRYLMGWVHQSISQLAVVGKQQHAGGVDIQPSDSNPATGFQLGQTVKYRGAPFRILAGADLAFQATLPAVMQRAAEGSVSPAAGIRPKMLVTASLDDESLAAMQALGDVEYAPFRPMERSFIEAMWFMLTR